MKLEYSSFSMPGRGRDNQDCILEPLGANERKWCAIADGVGGRPDGARASQLAIETLRDQISGSVECSGNALLDLVHAAFDKDDRDVGRDRSMATTLSLLKIEPGLASVSHVGDTRVYHLRNQGILKRTKDQTEVQDLIDRGVLNKRQAARYHRKNVLTGYISSGKELIVSSDKFEVENGDRIVLLTDGVYNVVSMRSIRDISLSSRTVEDFSAGLRQAVEDAGVVDDYSALVLSVEE